MSKAKEKPEEPAEEETIDAASGLKAIAAIAGLSVAEGAPVIRMEEDLNAVAKRLGDIVQRLDLFEMNGELIFFDFRGERQTMTHQVFGTWINEHVVVASKYEKDTGRPIPGRLRLDECAVVLACQNFKRSVRRIKAVNWVRLPVVRDSGELEKLPWGYDAETQVYTVPGGMDYATDMDVEAAKVGLGRVDGDFPFSCPRSIAVQRAAMLALFAKHLPGGDGLRPGFLWLGNKPGCGKSVLAKSILYPVIGTAAAAKMKAKEDLDKELEAFVRAGVPYIFLDNVYGGLASASLDQLLTSKKSTGRALGSHALFEVDNRALVVVTGNKLELNEDAARRFLVIDLFEKGEAEQREITSRLDDDLMLTEEWRATQLARLWSLVAHWHAQGMPKAQVTLPTYERYGEMLGGIVRAAGFEEPFQKAIIPDSISPEKAEFVELVTLLLAEMGDMEERDFTLEDMARLSRAAQLFQKHVGTQAEGVKLSIKEDGLGRDERNMAEDRGYMTPAHRSAFGKRIVREIGTEPVVNGHRVEFGKRKQSRKAVFTVRRIP